MTTPHLRDPDGPGSVFLVERYLPPTAAGSLAAAVARAAKLAAFSPESASADQVEYLFSAYLPAEDTCFCLFRAETTDAIRAVNRAAEFPLDRIVAAVLLYPTIRAPGEPRGDNGHRP